MREGQAFLRRLGRRLRAARERAELGVSETARMAGVSRRTVTDVEAGRANPSVTLLLRLAGAVERPLAELVEGEPGPRAQERVALVGLRGAGKSTVGRLLARELEVPFVELDRRVEGIAGLSLGEIFGLHGEEVFHRFEAEALEQVLSEGERLVLATGGSIVDSEASFGRLRATCRTIWLAASPEDHVRRVLDQGDRRPMHDRPRAMEELRALLARREPLYGLCQRRIATSGRPPGDVVREVLAWCRAG